MEWSPALDAALLEAVTSCAFDFMAVARKLAAYADGTFTDSTLTADVCRMRFAALHGLSKPEEGSESEEESAEEASNVKPLRWSIELDRLLVETTVAESYDFESVGKILGGYLGMKKPVPANHCRLRFAAVDRNMVLDNSSSGAEPSAPSAAMPSAAEQFIAPFSTETSPVISEETAQGGALIEAAKLAETTVKLALPPDDVMRELALAFGGQVNKKGNDMKVNDEDEGSDSSKFDCTSGGDTVDAMMASSMYSATSSASEERSELRQVLDFLEHHDNVNLAGSNEEHGGNSFEELFGIPESMLDRSVALPRETSDDDGEKAKKSHDAKKEEHSLFVDRGHFDLSDPRYAATFDRVARAIGAYN